MLFNSTEFAVFFAIVLATNWLVSRNLPVRNLVLLVSSMLFYGMFHYSFCLYLGVLIALSYGAARIIAHVEHENKRFTMLVTTTIVLALGLLYTKYSSFLLGDIPALAGWQASVLHILTPVGISFYTFTMLGYVLDVYYESIEPEKNILTYASFVSFFPHLLMGPIASSTELLPQFRCKPQITLNAADEGIGEFLWGLFKKVVVADNLEKAVSYCFSANNEDLSGSSLFVGGILFGIYIYSDFSGYSSMARGTAKLLGFNLAQNFRTPFFSTSVSEYWRRWHISLSNWLTAYIYNPIVYTLKRWGVKGVLLGIFITFFVSGIWHGAGWQFIVFGVLNGLAIIYEILTKSFREKMAKALPRTVHTLLSNIIVLLFMHISWVFFRAANVRQGAGIMSRIYSASLFTLPEAFVAEYLLWGVPVLVVEWVQRKGSYLMDIQQWMPVRITTKNRTQKKKVMLLHYIIKVVLYLLLIAAIYLFHRKTNTNEYYYFKF